MTKHLCYIRMMIVSLVLLAFCHVAEADCARGGLTVFPENELLPTSAIVIGGYARSQEFIDQIVAGAPLFLQSDEHVVELAVLDHKKGSFLVRQVLLQPAEVLKIGASYSITTSPLSTDGSPMLADGSSSSATTWGIESFSWEVVPGVDEDLVCKPLAPSYSNPEVQFFGCGPSINACFSVELSAPERQVVLARLEEVATGKVQEYYVTVQNQQVLIGHGMCAGPFEFGSGDLFRARFQPFDLASWQDHVWSDWISFEHPSTSVLSGTRN